MIHPHPYPLPTRERGYRSAVEASLVRAARLRQSVLRSAFEGRTYILSVEFGDNPFGFWRECYGKSTFLVTGPN